MNDKTLLTALMGIAATCGMCMRCWGTGFADLLPGAPCTDCDGLGIAVDKSQNSQCQPVDKSQDSQGGASTDNSPPSTPT